MGLVFMYDLIEYSGDSEKLRMSLRRVEAEYLKLEDASR